MKHEFKVGELVRFIDPELWSPEVYGAGLGFINKITPRLVGVVYANGYARVHGLSEFNNRFERATKIK